MNVNYLLDSVILIDHLNHIAAATAFLAAYPSQLAISVITRAEVLTGTPIQYKTLIQTLLNQFMNFDVTVEIADLAAHLRRQEGWKLPDALQAAIAQHHQIQLVTRNTKDFPAERYPFVLVPYRI